VKTEAIEKNGVGLNFKFREQKNEREPRTEHQTPELSDENKPGF
jgi:hypothetical protein